MVAVTVIGLRKAALDIYAEVQHLLQTRPTLTRLALAAIASLGFGVSWMQLTGIVPLFWIFALCSFLPGLFFLVIHDSDTEADFSIVLLFGMLLPLMTTLVACFAACEVVFDVPEVHVFYLNVLVHALRALPSGYIAGAIWAYFAFVDLDSVDEEGSVMR
jgi:hypothetical protein